MTTMEIYHKADENKKMIDMHRLLSDYTVKQLKEYFRIGFTYSSNALEAGGKPIRGYLEAITNLMNEFGNWLERHKDKYHPI